MTIKRDEDDDDIVDRQIAAAINVDPSSDLAVRICDRVAIESSRNRWNYWWVVAAGGAAAATTVVVLGVAAIHPQAPVSQSEKSPAVVAQPAIQIPTNPRELSALTQNNVGSRRDVSRRIEQRGETELVIVPGEAQAIAQLLDEVRTSKVDLSQVMDGPETMTAALPAIDDISIPLITIEALADGQ